MSPDTAHAHISKQVQGLASLLLPVITILAVMSGCGFKPDEKIDPPVEPRIYPSRTAPESALVYLTIAWERRDSLAADSVYADDYTGSSVDLTDPSPTTFPYTKSEEVRIVANMALDQNIIGQSVVMDLFPTQWIRQANEFDPVEYVTIKVPEVRIQFTVGVDQTYLAASASSDFFFTFRPTVPAPGDTLWEIVRWQERWF